MCDSLYVKANGEMTCWDDVGESKILRQLDESNVRERKERDLFSFRELVHIRRSFREGGLPYPGTCERCAVRSHGGIVRTLYPTRLRILHIESSYLCHLSCPECIPAKLRGDLKGPPYNMTTEMLKGLLRQLQDEGVQAIETIHFEGRGDPLLNPAMGELIKITKHLYPRAFTMATTHGSYRYFPWIVDSGLDLLRVSIDGAYAESYLKYRVGGDFDRTIAFLKQVRDERERSGSHLRVMWKYILFEWNDSDDEIRHAAQLANELKAELNFVLTYSPGRSKRFPDKESLKRIKSVAPDAGFEVTFQMKSPDDAPVEGDENRKKVRRPIEWPRLDNLWLWCRRKARFRTRVRKAFATITRATTASRHDRA